MVPTHQSVSVVATSTNRIAEQDAIAKWQSYRHGLRRSLREKSELGQALVHVQETRKGGFQAWLKERSIPQATAYRAILIARNWHTGAKVDQCANSDEALKQIKESLLAIDAEGNGPDAEPTPELKIAEEAAAATPSPDLRDADGCVLPESVRPAIEQAAKIDEWVTKAKLLAKEIQALAENPAGVHLPAQVMYDGIRHYAVMAKRYKADPIYRCNLCHGAGCERCKKSGWLPKLLYDQANQVSEAA